MKSAGLLTNRLLQQPLIQATRIAGNQAGLKYSESKEKNPDTVSQFIEAHPYASALGYKIPVGGASKSIARRVTGSPTLGGSLGYRLASAPMEMIAGKALYKKLQKNKDETGIGGRYSKDNPILGPALTSFIPGLGINANVAGEELARQAIKEKNFLYRNPEASAILATLAPLPGFHRSHAHAATVIRNYKKNKKANILGNLENMGDLGQLEAMIGTSDKFLGLGDIRRGISKASDAFHNSFNAKLVSRVGGALTGYALTDDPKYSYLQRAGAVVGGGVAGDLFYRSKSPLLKLIESKKEEAIKDSMLKKVIEKTYKYTPSVGVSAALLSTNKKELK